MCPRIIFRLLYFIKTQIFFLPQILKSSRSINISFTFLENNIIIQVIFRQCTYISSSLFPKINNLTSLYQRHFTFVGDMTYKVRKLCHRLLTYNYTKTYQIFLSLKNMTSSIPEGWREDDGRERRGKGSRKLFFWKCSDLWMNPYTPALSSNGI